MINIDEQHRKSCLRRYYENMDKAKALSVLGNLSAKKAKAIFKKRINYAKGYEFI